METFAFYIFFPHFLFEFIFQANECSIISANNILYTIRCMEQTGKKCSLEPQVGEGNEICSRVGSKN